MMINETRILNEFIELVSVPCPSKDEKAEADLPAGIVHFYFQSHCLQEDRRDNRQCVGIFTGQCRGCSRTVF